VRRSKRRRASSSLLNKEQKSSTWAILETERKSLKRRRSTNLRRSPRMGNDLASLIFYFMYNHKESLQMDGELSTFVGRGVIRRVEIQRNFDYSVAKATGKSD
jgi:hypothetical protein